MRDHSLLLNGADVTQMNTSPLSKLLRASEEVYTVSYQASFSSPWSAFSSLKICPGVL